MRYFVEFSCEVEADNRHDAAEKAGCVLSRLCYQEDVNNDDYSIVVDEWPRGA